jgi:hypothetical protein
MKNVVLLCVATAAFVIAAIAFGFAAPAASAHRSWCHSRHTCPGDHATYRWRGLLCVKPTADERNDLPQEDSLRRRPLLLQALAAASGALTAGVSTEQDSLLPLVGATRAPAMPASVRRPRPAEGTQQMFRHCFFGWGESPGGFHHAGGLGLPSSNPAGGAESASTRVSTSDFPRDSAHFCCRSISADYQTAGVLRGLTQPVRQKSRPPPARTSSATARAP